MAQAKIVALLCSTFIIYIIFPAPVKPVSSALVALLLLLCIPASAGAVQHAAEVVTVWTRSYYTPAAVVDLAPDGTKASALTAADVDALRRHYGIVLARLSVGRAEPWRDYWNPQWEAARQSDCYEQFYDTLKRKWSYRNTCPADNAPLVGSKTPDWDGELAARYWDERWYRDAIEPQLESIWEAGFDGVSLINTDSFRHWGTSRRTTRHYAQEMAELMLRIARAARKTDSEAIVVSASPKSLFSALRAPALEHALRRELNNPVTDYLRP